MCVLYRTSRYPRSGCVFNTMSFLRSFWCPGILNGLLSPVLVLFGADAVLVPTFNLFAVDDYFLYRHTIRLPCLLSDLHCIHLPVVS